MNLLIEYFKPSDYLRYSEYLTCIHENLENEFIDKIYIFISDDSKLNFKSDKIEIIKREERPTYKDLFEFCNENLKNQVCIISNLDIIFDETLSAINKKTLKDTFIGLTRWEIFYEEGEWCIAPFDNSASQDSWIFKAPIKISGDMNFLMGKPGCDNKIAKLMSELGYIIKNPGKQIVTSHYHISGHRTYDNSQRIPGPYLCLVPNDDINSPCETIEIDGFDEQGRPFVYNNK